MRVLPVRAVVTSFVGLLTLCVGMKALTDYCLPQYQTSSKIFPFRVAQVSEERLCRNMRLWDAEARAKQQRINSKKNMLYQGPGIFEDEDGSPSAFLFSRDLQKLTLMLDSIPKNRLYLFQLLITIILVSIMLGLIAQWIHSWAGGYLAARNVQDDIAPSAKPSSKNATEELLEEFLE